MRTASETLRHTLEVKASRFNSKTLMNRIENEIFSASEKVEFGIQILITDFSKKDISFAVKELKKNGYEANSGDNWLCANWKNK